MAHRRQLAYWLFTVAGFVVLMVLVGGLTRLTDSGLSITEWQPISGALPPLNAADWEVAFAKYREIPEYQLVNAGMSLEAFKGDLLVGVGTPPIRACGRAGIFPAFRCVFAATQNSKTRPGATSSPVCIGRTAGLYGMVYGSKRADGSG